MLDNGEVEDGLVGHMAGVLTWCCAFLYGRWSARNRALKSVGYARGTSVRPRLSVAAGRMPTMSERVSLGEAGRHLGVSGGDIRRAGHAHVSSAQVEEWVSNPPQWLAAARARKQRSRRTAGYSRRDNALVPQEGARALGLPAREVARLMREAGQATHPLRVKDARLWADRPDAAPQWLGWQLRKHQQQVAAENDAGQARLDQAYRDVVAMLGNGDRKIRQGHWPDSHDDHSLLLAGIAWRAAKDCGLASGDEDPDWWTLTFEEREALRVMGYRLPAEPDDHGRVVCLAADRHNRD